MKNKYIVKRRCIAQDFVFIEADHAEEAIARVQQGEGKEATITLEMIKPLPPTEWDIEELTPQGGVKA